MPRLLTFTFAAVVFSGSVAATLATEPPSAVKPDPGPAVNDRPATPKAEPEDPAHKRYSDSVDARDKADLMRADYEKSHKPGPVAEADTKQFEKIIAAYRAAIEIDPRSEVATYCRARIAGAYTYTGDFESAQRVLIEAVNIAKGPLDQIRACHEVALHELQARHKPAEALRWYNRAAAQLDKLADPDEKAKWQFATQQGIERCEKEMGK
jgi:tetratricopeptide (TPR) repeat protein